jgi:hypothetical protein
MIRTEYAAFCTEDLCDYVLADAEASPLETELAQRLAIALVMLEERLDAESVSYGEQPRGSGKAVH